MSRDSCLHARDVAGLMRLCNELHELAPNPIARHEHMLTTLCRMTGARVAVSAMVDFSRAGFSDLKVQSINTLPMGVSCKTQLQFTHRAWYDVGCNSEIRLPAAAFNTTWDVTRGQPGEAGIFNFFAGGTQPQRAGEMENGPLALLLMNEAAPLIPGLADLWNGLMIKNAWQYNPWSFGSYSAYQPGYQTTLVGIERVPEGNCFFAGEHTASENGFLNAAVTTGKRAAREVAASLVA